MLATTCRRRTVRARFKDWILVGPRFSAPRNAIFINSFSSQNSNVVNGADPEQSFTFSYLINSCGLSSKDALSVSKKIRLKSPEKPDAVLNLLGKYGVTNAHLPRLVTRWPFVLRACPAKTLLPKLEFFCSIGVPAAILVYPMVFHRSLKDYLIPSYNYIRSFVGSDERVVKVISHAPRAFAFGWGRQIPTNIGVLRERGLPESSIFLLAVHQPRLLMRGTDKLTAIVDRAAEAGYDASKSIFVHAMQVFAHMSESTLKRKTDVYKRCGWSDSDIRSARSRYPLCMLYSEKKIQATMDFLVNKFGCEPAAVAQCPVVMGLNLEKRIKPRCMVIGMLKSKGLVKTTTRLAAFLIISEEKFLMKYIIKYHKDIPELMDMYKRLMPVQKLDSVDERILNEVSDEC